MSGKRNRKPEQPFKYDDTIEKEAPKREETMTEIFNLNDNKTFSSDPKPVKVKEAWGVKPKK